MIPATPVGEIVARGEADLGFQQMSELKPIRGIDLVGPLPPEVQQVTMFSAGVLARAKQPEAARTLIDYLASPTAAQAIRDSGMEPMGTPATPDDQPPPNQHPDDPKRRVPCPIRHCERARGVAIQAAPAPAMRPLDGDRAAPLAPQATAKAGMSARAVSPR